MTCTSERGPRDPGLVQVGFDDRGVLRVGFRDSGMVRTGFQDFGLVEIEVCLLHTGLIPILNLWATASNVLWRNIIYGVLCIVSLNFHLVHLCASVVIEKVFFCLPLLVISF